MAFRYLWIRLVVVALLALYPLSAQVKKAPTVQGGKPTSEWILNNGSQGRDFVFCLPLNDCASCGATAREIYVTSSKNTSFDYEVPALGFKSRLRVTAGKVTVIDGAGGVFPIPEVIGSETVSDLCISIKADDYVSVYVYNGKQVSSDGYLAIPVQSWGKEYYALTYPDFNEARNWKAGFCFFASEDNTLVDIYARSASYGEYATTGLGKRTEGGHKYGDHWQVNLMRGQAYIVQGDGTTRGQFDLSGTRVVATKPIGFIDFHQRTMFPCFNLGGGRDHVCEMVPPVEQWGKTYVTVEFVRGGLGDLYRAVAKENGTNITWESYDFKTGKRLNGPTGVLGMRAGEVRSLPKSPEEPSDGPGSATAKSKGIVGMAIFKGNKPFQLMHECPSANWDNDNNFDPFTIYCVAKEQYTKGTIFQCPSNPAYTTHYFSLIAIGDSSDASAKLLKSIKIDGKFVYNTTPSFLGNRIPGTNLYYARIGISNGPHTILGDTPFGGEIYGYGQFDSYGWPAATAFKQLNVFDTLPPVLTRSEECGDFTYQGTEVRNFKVNDTLDHVETGIREIDFVDSADARSFNYRIVVTHSDGKEVQDGKVPVSSSNFKTTFRLEVIDKSKDAYAKFYVIDRAFNFTYDSVSWFAPRVRLNPDPVNFGDVRVGTSKSMKVWIRNDNDSAIKVKKIYMLKGAEFSVKSDTAADSTGLVIKAHDSILVTLSYLPTREVSTPQDLDFDSLLVKETCAPFAFYVRGRGVMPHIQVGDFDAGTVGIGESVCNSSIPGNLSIKNVGTDTLHVTGIDQTKITPPFSINKNQPTTPPFTIVIPPGQSVIFREVCFSPTTEDQWKLDIPFLSDAPSSPKDDPISTWLGSSSAPGPYVIGNDWDSVRLGVSKTLPCYIGNSGTQQVTCTAVDVVSSIPVEYTVTRTERAIPFIVYQNRLDSVRADVLFLPTVEGPKTPLIQGTFPTDVTKQAFLTGYGYLEKIQCLDAEIKTPQLAGNSIVSANAGEFVSISNTSTSRWLTIHSIDFINEADDDVKRIYPRDFAWTRTLPKDTVIDIGSAPFLIPVRFTASKAGPEHVRVRIVHNAEPITANPTGTFETIVMVTAYGIIQNPPYVKGHDFGLNTACDHPAGVFTVGNSAAAGATNSDRILDSVWIDGPDAANFSISGTPTPGNPITIQPASSVKLDVVFNPTALRTGTYKAYVHARFNDGLVLTDSLLASTKVSTIAANVAFAKATMDMATDGSVNELSLSAVSTQWADAGVKSFTAGIRYNRFDIIYMKNTAQLGAMFDNSWKIDSAVQVNTSSPDSVDLIVTASGSTPVSASGDLVKVKMQILIDSMKTQSFTAPLADFKPNGREACVLVNLGSANTSIVGCYMGGRFVKVSETPFALRSVSPQPAQDGFAKISYAVGFETHTTLDVVNEKGEVVAVLTNGQHKAGEYTYLVDVHAFASGVYRVRMTSAGSLHTLPLVITH